MLQIFNQSGMNDVEFIIVNSKQKLSQYMLPHLLDRVSFKVYQETEDEQVWNVLEGGKDDMFVYDRCGRLSYYIPFPLSIIHEEQPIVFNSILNTYFKSPCGITCEKNGSVAIENYMEEMDVLEQNKNVTSSQTSNEVDVQFNETDKNITTYLHNSTLKKISTINYNESKTSNGTINDDYYDLNQFNETNEYPTSENTFLKGLYKFFWQYENKNPTNDTTFNETENEIETSNNEIPLLIRNENSTVSDNETLLEKENKIETQKQGRCLEADYQVCKNWSKKKLLHAQTCCSIHFKDALGEGTSSQTPDSCKRFGKKRCKKTQTILKCCLKTELSDVDTQVTETETTTIPSTTAIAHTVCCKKVDNKELCYVSETLECDKKDESENVK